MNTKIKSIIGSIITAFSINAQADQLTVVCFDQAGDGVYYGFDDTLKQFTYSWGNESCIVQPNSAWSDAHSWLTLSLGTSVVKAETQIVKGDVIQPIFECNAEVEVAKNGDGDWILQKGTVWHNDIKNEHAHFIGSRCYVQ